MKSLISILAGLVLALSATHAQAVTVSAGNPATFAIDLSSRGDVDFGFLYFSCNACSDGDHLQTGKTLRYDIGTTPGGSEIRAGSYTNGFGVDITNANLSLVRGDGHGGVFYPGAAAILDTIYLTFTFVDDIFGIDVARLRTTTSSRLDYLYGTLVPPTVSQVPLPAPALLLGGALVGLGAVARRKRAKA